MTEGATTELVLQAAAPLRPVPRGFSLDEVRQMAESVARSGMFPGITNPTSAFTLMMLCQSEGLHPMQALKRYSVIQNRPAMRSDAMLADFQARGGKVDWLANGPEGCSAVFHAPGLSKPVTVSWGKEDAARAGLWGKDNWKKFPRQMFAARVISEGIRLAMPAVVAGVYAPEEVVDFGPEDVPLDGPARVPRPQNHSGHKTGQYASDDQVEAYRRAILDFCAARNAQWLDEWTSAHGELAEGIQDLVQPGPLTYDLLATFIRSGELAEVPLTIDAETGKVIEQVSSVQAKRYVAIVFARDPGRVQAEAETYARRLAEEARADWFREARADWFRQHEAAADAADEAILATEGGREG